MPRIARLAALSVALLALRAPEALAQAGGGSSGFSGGGGGGGFGGGGAGAGSGGGGFSTVFLILFVVAIVVSFAVRGTIRANRGRARAAREKLVTTASAEAAEEDPMFAAAAVKTAATALYKDIQRAWTDRDDVALERMLGPDLLVEWRRRLADYVAKGWVNEVEIRMGPWIGYVGLVNREGTANDRVTVTIDATLRSIVRTSDGRILMRSKNGKGDGVLNVCEYWTLARFGDAWRLISIEQEQEGAHHLTEPIVAAPWSDDARLADASLVELVTADAPSPGTSISALVSLDFDGTAREKALDLALADPRCAPDVLEVAVRRAVDAWAEAVDGDDAALLEIATPQAARALLYRGRSAESTTRVVVRGPKLKRLAITALRTDRDPPRMDVVARIRGRRYIEDRDTAAIRGGSKDRETEFTERWTFALDGSAEIPWRLVASGTPPRTHAA